MLEQGHHKQTCVELGRLVATPNAIEALMAAGVTPVEFLARHQCGDWGELDKADTDENELSLCQGFRLLSEYALPDTRVKIWIITEADRSVTTIMLPEDY